jgi:hypothetical protein
MSETVLVQVLRGSVDVPDDACTAERQRIERRSGGIGFGARNCLARRYHVGETVILEAGEAARLASLGFVRAV